MEKKEVMIKMAKYHLQIKPQFSRLHHDKDIPFLVPVQVPLIIGVIGKKFAGKSEVVKHLVGEYHLDSYSLALYVKKEAVQRYWSVEYKDPLSKQLKDLGDKLRKEEIKEFYIKPEFQGGYLASQFIRELCTNIVEKGIETRGIVVEGFKNPAEVKIIKNFASGKFFPIAVKTDVNIRSERWLNQEGEEMPDFDALDCDKLKDRPWGRNVEQCIDLVEKAYIIDNNSSKKKLFMQIDTILAEIRSLAV